jgi:MYXO-CTERM domain-containing protein
MRAKLAGIVGVGALTAFAFGILEGNDGRSSHSAREHGNSPAPQAEVHSAPGASWGSLPLGTRIGIERAMAEGDAACAPEVDGDVVRLRSPNGPSVRLVAGGAELPLGAHRMRLAARSVGRAEHRTSLEASSAPSVEGHEARMDRGHGVVEWWRALRRGLEHGVTLASRPEGEGEVVVEIDFDGSLAPDLRGETIELVDGEGRAIARYGEMFVADARGWELASRFEVDGRQVRIWFEDTGAEYPVVVDPMVFGEEQKLLASDKASGDLFGRSVAMSTDGSRVIVGAPHESDPTGGSTTGNGAAYVFVRSGSTWTEEKKLLASDKASSDRFGYSVAMSGDGSRVVVGAPTEDDATGGSTTDNGAAYVFVRLGSTWTEEKKLLASEKVSDAEFGRSVAMSGDGSRVVVGAPFEGESFRDLNGAAYVFVRSGSTWGEEKRLLAFDNDAGDCFGWSVAMSGDGSRVVAGAPFENDATGGSTTNNGAAYVFVRSGSTWSGEQKLLASDKMTGDELGSSVAMSGDGSRVVVGASGEDDSTGTSTIRNGAAYVFVRSESTWSEEQKLLASDKASDDYFGRSVAMSGDGLRLVVGASGEDDTMGGLTTYIGAAYVFERSGSMWSEEQKLLASDNASGDCFGTSVAMSGDGSRVIVGARMEDDATGTSTTDNGAAYVFALENGLPCSLATDCSSGFCVDGFCCEAECGGGATDDCQACSRELTGVKNGTCAPLSEGMAPTVTCRPSVGDCDIAEVCVAGDTSCPPDTLESAGTICRPAADPTCDIAETCTGSSPLCPEDGFAPATTVCRPMAYPCDVAEFCTGSSSVCPADTAAADGDPCDDGLVCTQSSACQFEVCAPSIVLDCSDGDPCTIDSCVEPSGCVHTPVADCSGEMDAGVDGGTDGGDTEPPPQGGCSCSVGAPGSVSPAPSPLFALVLLAFLGMRRARRSRGQLP